MNRQFLLDTNILTELARIPFGPCAHRLKAINSESIFTSVIVAGEVQYGIARYQAFRLRSQMEQVMDAIEIRPLQVEAVAYYGTLRTELEEKGTPIGANDMWIAAHALAEDAVLVTNNVKEFSRIAGMKVENWMETS